MRLVFALIFLLALPVLVIAHRQHYSTGLQGTLFVQVSTVLDAPEFAQVDPSLNYMDVQLKGRVAELPLREKARKLADGIRGLRCRESDNHIQVNARLTGELKDKRLSVSGWLHDEATLRDVTLWLGAARPDLTIDTEGVQVSRHVTEEVSPGTNSTPAAPFRAVWAAIEVPASLKIVREGSKLHMSGNLPNAALKDAVIASGPGSNVESSALKSGVYVRNAGFADVQNLPAFLRAFFSTPGAARFEADAKSIHASGNATPSMQKEWLAMLEPLAVGARLEVRFQLYPSTFHFPGYQRESKIPADALVVLQDVLRAGVINFGPGYATVDANENAKLIAVASAIVAAGPEARIIVGGHVDVTGNAKDNVTMARRRAESMVTDLSGRGVPPQVLEVAVFEPVPGAEDRSRQVEFLVK